MLTTTATRAAVGKALLPGPCLLAAIVAAILVSTALPLAAPILTRRFVDGLIAGVGLGPLPVDWDGAGADCAEWELTRAALHFSGWGRTGPRSTP